MVRRRTSTDVDENSNAILYGFTVQMMNDMNVEFEFQVRPLAEGLAAGDGDECTTAAACAVAGFGRTGRATGPPMLGQPAPVLGQPPSMLGQAGTPCSVSHSRRG